MHPGVHDDGRGAEPSSSVRSAVGGRLRVLDAVRQCACEKVTSLPVVIRCSLTLPAPSLFFTSGPGNRRGTVQRNEAPMYTIFWHYNCTTGNAPVHACFIC
eukprot:COSAG06_NODE_33723_length_485_cov_0.924870_1_plen_100_part_10